MLDLQKLSEPKTYVPISIGTITFCFWYNLHPQTCISFFLGVLSTLAAEFGGIYYFLSKQAIQSESSKITVSLANLQNEGINLNKPLERSSTEAQIKDKDKDKPKEVKEEESKVADELEFSSLLESQNLHRAHSAISEINEPLNNSLNNSDIEKITTLFEKQKSLPMSQLMEEKPQKKLGKRATLQKYVLDKMARTSSRRKTVTKIGHKEFMNELDEISGLFKNISHCEEEYGKGDQDLSLKEIRPKESHHFQIKSLNENEVLLITGKIKRDLRINEFLQLPNWKKFKETIYFVGSTHLSCSVGIDRIYDEHLKIFIAECDNEFRKREARRNNAIKEYEDVHQSYQKIKAEYQNLEASLESSQKNYSSKVENREDSESLLKQEMKVRLLKMQLDTMKNKLSEITDRQNEQSMIKEIELEEINNFVKQREAKKVSICQKAFKNLMVTLLEKFNSAEMVFESLIEIREEVAPNEPKDLTITEQTFDINQPVLSEKSSLVEQNEKDDEEEYEEHKEEGKGVVKKPRKRDRFFKAISRPFKHDSPKAPSNEKASFHNPQEENVNKHVLNIKERLKYYTKRYDHEVDVFEKEVDYSKDILSLLRQMIENQNTYIQNKKKIVALKPSSSQGESIENYWALSHDAMISTMNANIVLFDKISGIEKHFYENIRSLENEVQSSKGVIQDATKKIEKFIKESEKHSSGSSLKSSIKQFLHKSKGETDLKVSSHQASSVKEDYDEDAFEEEMKALFKDFDKTLQKLNHFTQFIKERNPSIKKDILFAYLKCYNDQKKIYSELSSKVETFNTIIKDEKALLNVLSEAERQIEKEQNLHEEDAPNLEVDFGPVQEKPSLSASASKEELLPQEVLRELSREKSSESTEFVWFSQMLKVFTLEWAKSPYFKERMIKKVLRSLNKRKKTYIKEFEVKDFVIGSKAPEIRKIELLASEPYEFICDFDLSYQGGVLVEIEAKLEPQKIINAFSKNYLLPVKVKALMRKFHGKVRICWKPSEYGPSWFSFVGEPFADIQVDPLFGNRLFNMTAFPKVESFLKNLIAKKLKKMTYPHRKELRLPLATRSLD